MFGVKKKRETSPRDVSLTHQMHMLERKILIIFILGVIYIMSSSLKFDFLYFEIKSLVHWTSNLIKQDVTAFYVMILVTCNTERSRLMLTFIYFMK